MQHYKLLSFKTYICNKMSIFLMSESGKIVMLKVVSQLCIQLSVQFVLFILLNPKTGDFDTTKLQVYIRHMYIALLLINI